MSGSQIPYSVDHWAVEHDSCNFLVWLTAVYIIISKTILSRFIPAAWVWSIFFGDSGGFVSVNAIHDIQKFGCLTNPLQNYERNNEVIF